MTENWMKWAVAEGITKINGHLAAKFAGISRQSLTDAFSFTLIIGLFLAISGFIGAKLRGKKIFSSAKVIVGGVTFGLVATIMTVLGVVCFLYPGADVGVVTFIYTCSIIPGALIDRFYFSAHFKARQYLGIMVFLAAGYGIVESPNIGISQIWVWIAILLALLAALNEAIMQLSKNSDPMINNFLIGITIVTCCVAGLSWYGWEFLENSTKSFWIVSILAGINVVGMLTFKLFAYREGGSIAFKKLIMQGVTLIGTILLGAVFYGESLTAGKLFGMVVFFPAFILTSREIPIKIGVLNFQRRV